MQSSKISRSLTGLLLVSTFAALTAPVLADPTPAEKPAAQAQTVATEPVEVEKPIEKRIEKIIRRYELAAPDLSEEQKARIVAIGGAIRLELDAIRDNAALTDTQKQQKREEIYEGLYARTDVVLTPAQLVKWKESLEARRRAAMEREYNLRAGETVGQKQARILKPFVDALPDLTAEQKAKILPIAEGASDVLDEVRSDSSRTEAQKAAIEKRVNKTTLTKLGEALTKKQLAQWTAASQTKAKKDENGKTAQKKESKS